MFSLKTGVVGEEQTELMRNQQDPEYNVYGRSDLGGNCVEGTSPADAVVRNTSVQDVPLVYEFLTGTYVTEQRAIEKADEYLERDRHEDYEDELRFLAKVGFKKSI